jgi:nitroreductase
MKSSCQVLFKGVLKMSEFNKIFSGESSEHMNTPDINFDEFEKVIHSRRSVRKFSSEEVPDTVIKKALDHALLAPNSSNLQTWEFYWIRSKEKRDLLNKAFLSQPAVTTAQELIVCVAKPSRWKTHAKKMADALRKQDPNHKALFYYERLVPMVYSLGVLGLVSFIKKFVLFFRGLKSPTPREVTSKGELNTWACKSAALACENIMLSVRAQGYDSCPMEGFDSKRVKSILNLSNDSVIVMGISVGKRAPGGVFGERFRFDKKDFIFEV